MWNLSVAGIIAAYSLLVRTRMPLWGVALELSIVGMLASAIILVRAFGILAIKVERDVRCVSSKRRGDGACSRCCCSP
jgi:hypothetical protein